MVSPKTNLAIRLASKVEAILRLSSLWRVATVVLPIPARFLLTSSVSDRARRFQVSIPLQILVASHLIRRRAYSCLLPFPAISRLNPNFSTQTSLDDLSFRSLSISESFDILFDRRACDLCSSFYIGFIQRYSSFLLEVIFRLVSGLILLLYWSFFAGIYISISLGFVLHLVNFWVEDFYLWCCFVRWF